MTEIEEGDLKFSFPDHCEAGKYDEWSFYRNQFQSVASGSKAVDILCLSDDAAWLIEIKDYRLHPRQKLIDIDDEVASKVRDTLAGLAAARRWHSSGGSPACCLTCSCYSIHRNHEYIVMEKVFVR